MGYDGHLQGLPRSPEQRRSWFAREADILVRYGGAVLKARGHPGRDCFYGRDGNLWNIRDYPGITEIQAGSYLLMDDLYVERGSRFSVRSRFWLR